MTLSDDESLADSEPYYTAISTSNTVVPRYIAAMMDNIIAMLLSVVAAKSIGEHMQLLAAAVLVGVYFGYFFISELTFSRTPGKLLTGLVVVSVDGERCSWSQVLIRTVFRLLEVNPLLLGAIPAALSVVFSAHHQRFGDKAAETLVVESRVLRQRR